MSVAGNRVRMKARYKRASDVVYPVACTSFFRREPSSPGGSRPQPPERTKKTALRPRRVETFQAARCTKVRSGRTGHVLSRGLPLLESQRRLMDAPPRKIKGRQDPRKSKNPS